VAGAIFTTYSLQGNGQSFTDSNYGTFDTFLHADFRKTHKNNLILPGGEYPCGPLPIAYDAGVIIRSISMAIDYIEFSDHTSVGSNRAGAKIISETREVTVLVYYYPCLHRYVQVLLRLYAEA